MARSGTLEFIALRLNYFRSESWAVVEHPSGALATDRHGAFLMRLPEREARDLARALTAELLDRAPRPDAAPVEAVRRLTRSAADIPAPKAKSPA